MDAAQTAAPRNLLLLAWIALRGEEGPYGGDRVAGGGMVSNGVGTVTSGWTVDVAVFGGFGWELESPM